MRILTLLVSLLIAVGLYAQGDNCATATSIGTLPTPAPCVGTTGGGGTTVTYNGTTVGAVAENPYSSLACMDAPAADVWISFVASGNEMDISFTSGLNDANIGIYTGPDCNNLTGIFCEASNNGNINATLQPFTPGNTYYMQISGIDENDFSAFTLNLTNNNNCALCVQDGTVTPTPAPVNGTYQPGQTVQFCITIDNFTQVSANWIHGFIPTFGAGWDLGSLTPISSPGPSTSITGYSWFWMTVPGIGTGFFVDEDDFLFGFDGDPTNNFGYPDLGPYTFCFEITTDASCTPGEDLSFSVNTTADGETGSWTSVACVGDADIPFTAVMACCDVPLITSTPTSCAGLSDGAASAEGQGGVAPYDYVWEDAAGAVIFTDNNNAGISSMSGLTAGLYTVTVTDDLGCVQVIDINVVDGAPCLCLITTFNALVSPCEAATNTFTVSGDFTYQDNPGTGSLIVEVTNGSGTYTQTFNPPFVDGALNNFSVSGIPSDGTALTVTVYFTDDVACTSVINSTSPASCACNVDIGTFSVATTGTQSGNDFVLCFGDDLDITANGDYTPAAEANNPPGPPYSPGIAWLVYSCPPTVALAPDPVLTIPDDPCLLGIVGANNLNETNDMFWMNSFPPGTFTDNTVYFVPITMYSTTNSPQIYSYTNTTMPCYETGNIYSVQYIPEITEVSVEDCATGTVTTTVSGGEPSMNGSLFTGTNLVPATASFAPGTAVDGGDIVVIGLVDGDVYSYDIIDDSGCPITVSGTFVGLEDPAFTYPQSAYCQDEANPNPTITGDAGGTFSSTVGISLNPTTGSINLAASTPGTYTITYQTPDPVCFATSTFDVTINPLPIVDGNDETICLGGSVTLNGTGADSYVWDNGVVDGVSFSPVATTTYTVTGTISATGCTNTGTATVTVNPLDDPSFTTTDYCEGGASPAAIVTGLAGGTFTFSLPPMDGATINATTGSITGGIGGTTYTIEYTTNGPCPQSTTQTVTVNDLPPVDAQDVSVCLGGTATITATGAVTYNWDNGLGAGQTHTVTPASNTVYTVTGTDANGCVNSDAMTVFVLANAPIDAGTDVTICAGDMTTLTASGGTSYTWAAPISAPGATQNVSPIATTTYTVNGSDANGCTGTDQVTVTVTPLPTATVAGSVTLCQNDPTPTITFTGSNGTAPYTFTYTINGGANQTVTSVGNTATVAAPTGTVGTFDYNLVSVTDGSSSACSQAQVGQATVTINPTPTATIAGTLTVCQGDVAPTITFTGADGTAPYTFTYSINGGANQTVTSVGNTATVTAPTGTVGVFDYNLVSVSDGSATGCSQTQVGQATITVNALPTATITGTTSVCEGSAGPTITFTGANGTAPYTFTYNINGGANQTITSVGNTATLTVPTGAVGTFNYNLVNVSEGSANGCGQVQAGTATITVNANPVPTINGASEYCTGTTSTLSTSIPYATYNWSTGVTTPTASVTAADNPITVTVTNAEGCSGTSAVFTVVENSVITYNSTVEICEGFTATIHGNVESVAGTYSQTFILPTGCDSVSNVDLIVHPSPVINPGVDQTVCDGTPITLNATGAPMIAWDNGVSNGLPFNQPVGTVTYTATGTDAFGCIGTNTVDVTVNPLPTATVTGTAVVCQNDAAPTITFTGSGGVVPYTFTYNINGGANQTIVSVGNTATVTASTGVSGIFDYNLVSVEESSAQGCSQSQMGTATITVNDLPTATIAGTIEVCQNDVSPLITFTGANGTAPYTFTYTINGGANQTVTSVGATATVSASTAVVGTFDFDLVSVSESSGTACSQAQTGTATVTVNQLPTATIAGTTTICQNDATPTITFTGANGTAPYTFTYSINGGANQTVVSVGTTATVTAPTAVVGTFNYDLVSVSDASSTACSQTQIGQATITVVPNPTATISGTVSVCLGDVNPTITLTGADGTAPYTFTYNVNNTGDVTVTSVGNSATVSVPTVIAGVFNFNLVSVSDASASGCSQAQAGTATVTVNDLPIVSAGNDLVICEGDQTVLTGSGATSYSWDQGVVNGVLFTPAATSTYTVTGTDANGCSNTDDVTITLEPAPVVSFVGDVLSGCEPLTVTFTNTTVGSLDNCVWTLEDGTILNGCGSVTTTFNTAGTFDVSLTTTSTVGCVSTATYTDYIYVEDAPNASFSASSTLLSTLNPQVYFDNTSTGAVNYEWNFGDGSPISTTESPIHEFPDDESGTYEVELIAYSPLGCSDTAYTTIQLTEEVIFYVPNTFTPDDDDYNPVFQPVFTSGYDPFDYTLLIFDRWGEIIFESHNADIGWDGTYGGRLMQDGTYTWKIEFKTTTSDERKVVVGHVNMIR